MDQRQDESLLAELRSALATLDPVPDGVVAAAKGCFTWRSVDEELAELIADSATEPLMTIRSPSEQTEARLLTFEAPGGLSVEVEVTIEGDERRLVGQLIPPKSAQVEVRWRGGSVTRQADSLGLFAAGSVPAGPVSIACHSSEQEGQVVTSWVTI